jgi:hypothetical protein
VTQVISGKGDAKILYNRKMRHGFLNSVLESSLGPQRKSTLRGIMEREQFAAIEI